MAEKVVLPTNDLVFKKLFANEQNKDVLKGFIQDFFDVRIREVKIKNPYSIKEFNQVLKKKKGHYFVEVDTICTTENNWSYHIELQMHPQKYYLERSLYYLSGTYQSTYGQEDLMETTNKYGALRPAFSINILGFSLFKQDDKAVHTFALYDKENEIKLSEPDLLTVSYFELHKKDRERKNLKYWQDLFLYGKADADAPIYMQRAAEVLKISNFSKGERKMIDALEKYTQDRIAREEYLEMEATERGMQKGLEKGLAKGLAEGLTQGRTEEKLKMALKLVKELNLSVRKTMEMVELSEDLQVELVAQLEKQKIPYVR